MYGYLVGGLGVLAVAFAGAAVHVNSLQQDVVDTLLENSAAFTLKVTDEPDRAQYQEKLDRVVESAVLQSNLVGISIVEPFGRAVRDDRYNFAVVFVDMPFEASVSSLFDREHETFYISNSVTEDEQIASLATHFENLAHFQSMYNRGDECVIAHLGDDRYGNPAPEFDPAALVGDEVSGERRECWRLDFYGP